MVFFSIFSFFFQNSSIQKNKINNFVKIEELNFQLFYNFYNFFKKERDYFLNFFQNINNIVFTNSDFFNFFFISY